MRGAVSFRCMLGGTHGHLSSPDEIDPKPLRTLLAWSESASRPTWPTGANPINEPEFSLEPSHRCIRLSIKDIGTSDLERIDTSRMRRDNKGIVVSNAGPYRTVSREFCVVARYHDAVLGSPVFRHAAG